jgi:DNA-binding GntR family transcriptional regulator
MRPLTELRAVLDACAARQAALRVAAGADKRPLLAAFTRLQRAAAEAMERFRLDTLARCWPNLKILFEAHRGIVDAILAGDPLAAEDAARRHLDAVWYRLAELGESESLPDDPREPIQRVATLVGYADPSRFAAHFRRHYGLTPRAYRDRFRGPESAAADG